MKQRPFFPLSAIALCMVPSAVWAQDTGTEPTAPNTDVFPEVVVTANRMEQPARDVLADVTVINRKQIEHSGAVNVADLLARQAGLELSRNGGPGTTSSVYMRGADTRFTAVYVDGVRVDSQATGGAQWEVISLGLVDRIEIVRGAAAAVYGSDAVAGVVQIFTKKGTDSTKAFTPYISVGGGSRRTGRLETGFTGKAGAVDYALGVERAVSDGFNATTAGDPDKDGYRQTAANASVGVQISPDHRLELLGTYSKMDAQYDGYGSSGRDDRAVNRLTTLGANWHAQWSPVWSTKLSVNESRQRYVTLPDSDYYLTNTRVRSYLFQNVWKLNAHTFTAALERREDKLNNSSITGWRKDRHQNAVALGYGLNMDRHTLQLNARHDHDSEFGGNTTGSAAYGYTFAPNWRVNAAVGTAFRAPTLYQRFSEYGTPSLEPEKSINAEVGVKWQDGANRFGVTAYRNRVKNLINFGAAGACASAWGCYENAGRAILKGVTVSGAYRLGKVNLHGSLDLQKPRNAETDKLLARRARRVLKLGAETQFEAATLPWTAGAEVQTSSKRYNDAANTVQLGGYSVFNLYASTAIARDWQLLARLDNIGNKKYQLANGYNTQGRTFFVNLRWTPR